MQYPLKKYEPFFYKRGKSTFADMRESATGKYVSVEDLKDCHCDSFINGELCVWNERAKCIGGPCRKRDRWPDGLPCKDGHYSVKFNYPFYDHCPYCGILLSTAKD